MWDNQPSDVPTDPPQVANVARVGVSLTIQDHDGRLMVAEYPNVSLQGSRALRHPLTNPDPYELRIGVCKPGDPWRMDHLITRSGEPRDLDLHLRGRIERVKGDGSMAYFIDVDATRENATKVATENKALRAEVRALRRRITALGGDK